MNIKEKMFISWAYAENIVEEAAKKKKLRLYPEMNYDELVESIAYWMNGWMRFTMPRLEELIDLMSDAYLLVMNATHKEVDIDNYEAFAEALRADVYRKLMEYIENCGMGVREFYKIKKLKNSWQSQAAKPSGRS